MTLTELRNNIYAVVEDVVKSGKTIEIESKGGTVLLSPGGLKGGKLERLRKASRQRAIVGNPDDLISVNWENEYRLRHI